jgi:predicted amidophosphoribosyltransferase
MQPTISDGDLVVELRPEAVRARWQRSWTFARYPGPVCPRCGSPLERDAPRPTCGACDLFEDVSSVTYIGVFDHASTGDLRAGIRELKDDASDLYANLFGISLALIVNHESPGLKAGSVLVPIPSHPLDHPGRAFVPSQAIARTIARHTGMPLDPGLLVKDRPHAQRGTALDDTRYPNVDGVFRANGPMDGRGVVLVDDVMATGATLAECARQCLGAGARRVDALVVGRLFTFREDRTYG